MSDGIKMKINGIEGLKTIFETLPDEVAHGAAKEGLRNGANVVLESAKAFVPVKTGKLRESLATQMVKISNASGRIVYKVLARRKGGFGGYHAHLVELGTKPHTIKPEKKASLFFGKYSKEVKHPGTKKRPFLRRALLVNIDNVILKIAEKALPAIKRRMKKYLAK